MRPRRGTVPSIACRRLPGVRPGIEATTVAHNLDAAVENFRGVLALDGAGVGLVYEHEPAGLVAIPDRRRHERIPDEGQRVS